MADGLPSVQALVRVAVSCVTSQDAAHGPTKVHHPVRHLSQDETCQDDRDFLGRLGADLLGHENREVWSPHINGP